MEVHCEERVTASQIASASVASFLPRLGQALTPLGGTSRTSWPSAINGVPNCPQSRASILIRHGARRAKYASNRSIVQKS